MRPLIPVANAMGLSLTFVSDLTTSGFWMIRDRVTGRELGSYVPGTGSVRCRGELVRVAGPGDALAVYARWVLREGGASRVRRAERKARSLAETGSAAFFARAGEN
jgi:hypothetical protein